MKIRRSFCTSMVLALLMFLVLMWSLFTCKEARADHWKQVASLLPGTYMLTSINLEQSAELQAIYKTMYNEGKDPVAETMNFIYRGPMLVFVVTPGSYNTSNLDNYFKYFPKTTPKNKPHLFRKVDIGRWIQVDLPCRWIEGKVM